MGLEKLKITVKKGEKAKGGVTQIEAHFNPNKIVLSKIVKLQEGLDRRASEPVD